MCRNTLITLAVLSLVITAWISAANAAPRPPLSKSDREFLSRAAATSAAEMKIARLAAQSAGTEEIQALARRLIFFNVRMEAALRELARTRNTELKATQPAAIRRTLEKFNGKTGRSYDALFREYLLTDPIGAIAHYAKGAAEAEDRQVRRLAERTYGELKRRRPTAATAYLRSRIVAARGAERAKEAKIAKTSKPKASKTQKRKPPANAKPAAAAIKSTAKTKAAVKARSTKAFAKPPPRAKVVAWPSNMRRGPASSSRAQPAGSSTLRAIRRGR